MTTTIKTLFTLVLLAFAWSASAGKVTVYNHAHYFVSFEDTRRHSGNFSVGQSRAMDNFSGLLRLNSDRAFAPWCSTDYVSTTYEERYYHLYVNSHDDVTINFFGDIINQKLEVRGLGSNIDGFYRMSFVRPCIWKRSVEQP